ncbi:aspartyl protease family protein [bacterium]|nr:aspartyl protease family protein [bacterium]
MRYPFTVPLIVSFLALPFCMGAGELASVKMTTDSLLITIPVHINGKGPFNFIIDTGAMASVLGRKTADSLELKLQDMPLPVMTGGVGDEGKMDELKLVTVDSISIGRLTREPQMFIVMDISHLAEATKLPISGIIGYDILSPYLVTLYFKEKEATFSDPPEKLSEDAIPFELRLNHIYVDCEINGVKRPFLFDTGASESAISTEFIDTFALKEEFEAAEIDTAIGAEGTAGEVKVITLAEVKIGGRVIPDVRLAAIDLSNLSSMLGEPIYGVIGNSVMRRYCVILDYTNRAVYLR